jgi:hypothetical protein
MRDWSNCRSGDRSLNSVSRARNRWFREEYLSCQEEAKSVACRSLVLRWWNSAWKAVSDVARLEERRAMRSERSCVVTFDVDVCGMPWELLATLVLVEDG